MIVLLLASTWVQAQEFPVKPIRIYTPQPGGATDVATRIVAQGLGGTFSQPIIVENRASRLVGETVAKSAPDGHSLAFGSGSIWLSQFIEKLSYDPVRDLAPVTLGAIMPNVLVVHPSLPVKSVKDLIALAKSRPGEIDYASGSTGGSSHLSAELLKSMAGINMVRIPFKAAGPAVASTIGGQVQVMFATAGSVTPHMKSGRLRGIAVTSAEPTPLVPGLPTVAVSGLPGYESNTTLGILAPSKTPPAVLTRLNQEFVRVLQRADVRERFAGVGMEAGGSTPAEFAAKIKSEMTSLGKLISGFGT